LASGKPDWIVGYLDEVWWSRFAQPMMHSWAQRGAPLRLVSRQKKKNDPEAKALSCYGVLLEQAPERQMLLRFVKGRPVSHVTTAFLAWVCQQLQRQGKRVWVLVWDNASWHISEEVRGWIRAHNQKAKREGGVRIVVCGLPVKSPWLSPIEPTWLHGKRAICEPEGELTMAQLMDRICAHYECELLPPLEQKIA
jgi:transposase